MRQTITESLSYQNQKLLFPAEIKEVLSYLWGVVKLGAFCHTLKEKRDSNPDAILQRFGSAMKISSSAIFKPKQFVVEEIYS